MIFHELFIKKKSNTLTVVLQRIKRETEEKITLFQSISEELKVYKHKYYFI